MIPDQPTKGQPKLQERFVTPIKAMIEENPSFGYPKVAYLLGMNKHRAKGVSVQGLAGTQASGGLEASYPGVAVGGQSANQRWATDLCRV